MSQQKNGALCEYHKLRRPRYFHGMLLDEKDFASEQSYHIAKRRLLNRMLHGSGVVCGLDLEWKAKRKSIKVHPGLALDCLGNDIWVAEPYTVDLEKLLATPPSKQTQPCPDPGDDGEPQSYWLCIYYKEVPSDPVPAYAASDCKGQTCDFSRWKEGFCFKLVDSCPRPEDTGLLYGFCNCDCGPNNEDCGEGKAYCPDVDCKGIDDEDERCRCWALADFCSKSLPCPDCGTCGCEEHCVVLGKVTVDKNGCLISVCINECRTYVLSGRMVQYLARSLYSGIEKWATLPDQGDLPSVTRMVENPIYGLCWWLRQFKLGGDKWPTLLPPWIRDEARWTDEGKKCLERPAPAGQAPAYDQATVQAVRQMVQDEVKTHMAEMDVRQEKWEQKADQGVKTRITSATKDLTERLAAVEKQVGKK